MAIPFSEEKLSRIYHNFSDFTCEFDQWHSAVNVILISLSKDDYRLAFIKRSHLMNSHAGEIAFLGGQREEDEDDPLTTAYREFEEETSISSDKLEFFSYLEPVKTTARNIVVPIISKYVGSIHELLTFIVSNGEWDDFYLVPVSKLFADKKDFWKQGLLKCGDKNRPIHFYPLYKDYCFINSSRI
jgi:8-oxo-dGTP pyrophosphatase MutT (NUDIX family)